MQTLFNLLPLVFALFAGYLLGKCLPQKINHRLLDGLTPLVWAMLFLIGYEFSAILLGNEAVWGVLKNALIFACCAMFGTGLILWPLGKKEKQAQAGVFSLKSTLPALKNTCIALSMVALGAGLFYVLQNMQQNLWLPSSSDLLLLLIVLIGMDFSQVKLHSGLLAPKILLVPALTIIGSLASAPFSAWLTGLPLQQAFAFSSGFGWFTLSSVMLGERFGDIAGSTALFADLFRELISFVLIYFIGHSAPQAAIGIAGATSSDTTLPVIKQTCDIRFIPLAMMNGLILSLCAPFLIALFL